MDMDIDMEDNLNNLDFFDVNVNENKSYNNKNTNKESNMSFILCPLCQTPIKPNPSNMCIKCLNNQVDISEGISKELIIFQCRQCERWHKNPQFIEADWESPKLLGLCIKKIRGLSKVKLTDAKFLWTEPHSKRIEVELTVQKEVFNGAIVEKTFVVEYKIENQQCSDCQESFTHHVWRASVQVRQKVNHKRTFLFLEQLILKHNMTQNCIGITEEKDGIDFFFSNRSNAQTFLSFIQSVVPVQVKNSKRLISQDVKSNVSKYKYSIFVEISPICRGDLVLIPHKLISKCGGLSPLMLCYKITTSIHFIDPLSLHIIELDTQSYFRSYFTSIANNKHLSKYFVMNCYKSYKKNNINRLNNNSSNNNNNNNNKMFNKSSKYSLIELELIKEEDIGNDDAQIFETVSHLGNYIREGDIVEGYNLEALTNASQLFQNKLFLKYTKKLKIPQVYIVKKHHYKSKHKRNWKLKNINKQKNYNVDKKISFERTTR